MAFACVATLLTPSSDGLVCVARDLFGATQAAPSQHDQERLGHLRGRGLQPIHRCSLRFAKVPLAAAAVIALPASMAPISYHMGPRTGRIGTRGRLAYSFLPGSFMGHLLTSLVSPPSRVATQFSKQGLFLSAWAVITQSPWQNSVPSPGVMDRWD